MPLLNSLPIQASLNNLFQQRQRDKKSESHAHDADPPGVDPAVEGGSGDLAACAAAEHAPGMRGSEHGQGGTRRSGIPPRRAWAEGWCGVRSHGFTFPPGRFTVEKHRNEGSSGYEPLNIAPDCFRPVDARHPCRFQVETGNRTTAPGSPKEKTAVRLLRWERPIVAIQDDRGPR